MAQRTRLILGRLITVLALGLATGCDQDDDAHDRLGDAAADEGARPDRERDAEPEADASSPDCYENPETYVEIINACTDAERVDKNPDLPQLLSDGSLPPLP